MSPESLIELLENRPFAPVRLHLSDGRKHEIRHPEMAIVSDDVVAIGLPREGDPAIADRVTNCATAHVVEVEPIAERK